MIESELVAVWRIGYFVALALLVAACVGTVLTYFLKSRCRKIKCLGLECDRTPVDLEPGNIEVISKPPSV